MLSKRVIAKLDIKGPNLVKGVHLEGLRVLGKPWWFAKHYYEAGADELIYMDVVASLYGRNSLLDFIKQTSKEIFIPVTVGGGIRNIEDAFSILRSGADKVAINTAAVRNPGLIKELTRRFGSSTIVVSIEAQRRDNHVYEVYTDNGREPTGIDIFHWAKEVASLGAGEILLTCINQEGTGNGYDVNLVRKMSAMLSIPVIACGGPGDLNHISEVIIDGKADAVAVASMLHYDFIAKKSITDEDFTDEGNISFLKSGTKKYRAHHAGIPEIKNHLIKKGIVCR